MVTNYPHAIAHDDSSELARRTAAGAGSIVLNLVGWMRQAVCGLHGHDSLLHFEQDRMYLKCASCGHESPGWELTEAPPRVLFRGDARRHALSRPQLVDTRRIA
jgi:hypothetical protein